MEESLANRRRVVENQKAVMKSRNRLADTTWMNWLRGDSSSSAELVNRCAGVLDSSTPETRDFFALAASS